MKEFPISTRFTAAELKQLDRTAVEAGVKCLEHGQLIDEDTAKLLADKGAEKLNNVAGGNGGGAAASRICYSL